MEYLKTWRKGRMFFCFRVGALLDISVSHLRVKTWSASVSFRIPLWEDTFWPDLWVLGKWFPKVFIKLLLLPLCRDTEYQQSDKSTPVLGFFFLVFCFFLFGSYLSLGVLRKVQSLLSVNLTLILEDVNWFVDHSICLEISASSVFPHLQNSEEIQAFVCRDSFRKQWLQWR